MRQLIVWFIVCFSVPAIARPVKNIIIVTTDGFRWQEVFGGIDSAVAAQARYNQGDSAGLFLKYYAPAAAARRQKLMPFLWSVVAQKGQIYGNRALGSKVDNANPYWFSYPGYSEIFCGFVDTAINSNSYKANPNTNVLEFINRQPSFRGKVAAFGAWNAFDRILNEERSGFPVVCGTDDCGGNEPDAEERLLNALRRDAYDPFGEEALDVFTHYAAMDYLRKQHPRVLYISYGETDEWAHEGHYRDYLNAAHQVDAWLGQLWNFIQSDPAYRDNTALFITVDHGRGNDDKSQWTSHNNKVPDSHEIWMAVMGPGINPLGEVHMQAQLYQQQFAQTIATLLGLTFACEHTVAPPVKTVVQQ